MFKTSRNYLLLSLVVIFAFVYRIVLMLRETFPPGADIGLHNSIIYSITQSGNTNFLYNYYHMGGGSSVTFPGYHIFVSYIILLTGMPDYLAHALVVSLFSSLIVLVAFLITKKAWNVSAALIVAFLVAVSRFDIEMLMWGGYPNVITLMLIPLAFYLFLEKDRFSFLPFLVVTSIISGAIFLTHSLSAALFVVITLATVVFGTVFSRKVGEGRKKLFIWLLPLILGALLIAPFLIQVAPGYLGANSDTFTGGIADIRQALLSTKVLPIDLVLPLFGCIILFFLFSRRYLGKYLTVPAILLALWTVIPAILTQGYLVGLYTDYNRFMYFVILPVIMLIGMVIYHSATFLAEAFDWLLSMARDLPQVRIGEYKRLKRLMPYFTRKNMLSALLIAFLLYTFLTVTVFVTPSTGIEVQSFYQLMNNPKYEAIQWAKTNTPTNSLFATDAEYGWWFSGFSQRPTISAVEPQYLTNAREFEPSKVARYVLDTDYLVDNGLIQVREDGGYIGRHNPEFLAKLNDSNSYFPYPFFNFDNSKISVSYRAGETQLPMKTYLSNVPVVEMHMDVENSNDTVSIYVTRQNQFFTFTQVTTISNGLRFANMTETIASIDSTVTFDEVSFTLPTKGTFAQYGNGSTVGEFDQFAQVAGQIIFTESQPASSWLKGYLIMDYDLAAKTDANMSFSVGLYQFKLSDSNLTAYSPEEDLKESYVKMLYENAQKYTQPVFPISTLPMDIFDYRQAIADQGIDYIALRDSDAIPRFAKDPLFNLVFINSDVAIFQVKKNLS
jgi:hypothetical protein